MPATAHKPELQITTIRIPKRLYEEARSMVENGGTDAHSLNELLVDSLSEKLKQLRRQRIDAEFAGMRSDVQYHRESAVLAEQFTTNDSETLRLAEQNKR